MVAKSNFSKYAHGHRRKMSGRARAHTKKRSVFSARCGASGNILLILFYIFIIWLRRRHTLFGQFRRIYRLYECLTRFIKVLARFLYLLRLCFLPYVNIRCIKSDVKIISITVRFLFFSFASSKRLFIVRIPKRNNLQNL